MPVAGGAFTSDFSGCDQRFELGLQARSRYEGAYSRTRRLLVRWLSVTQPGAKGVCLGLEGKDMSVRVSELEQVIAPIAEAMGYSLVRVRVTSSHRPVLQVMAERADGTMLVDDCARLSVAISTAFEQDDPIEGEYVLEVSSPGIDRPLTRRRDFEFYAGHEAKIELKFPLDGRKRVRGTLKGLKGEDVIIETEMGAEKSRGEMAIPYTSICEAKLQLTDALIEQDLKRRKTAGTAGQN
jgi:ribosome maturation factor RimP